jgi:hypothetical protein
MMASQAPTVNQRVSHRWPESSAPRDARQAVDTGWETESDLAPSLLLCGIQPIYSARAATQFTGARQGMPGSRSDRASVSGRYPRRSGGRL